MNGQIQYGSARRLPFQATRGRGTARTADPSRFDVPHSWRRAHVAAGGGFLLLALFLPSQLPPLAALVTFGAAWISLVLAMTLPTRSELAGLELTRRLAQFRHEVNAIAGDHTRPTLEGLVARATELGLSEDDVTEELAQLRAFLEAIDMKAQLSRGELPSAALGATEAGDTCHFACAVRYGRRRADQFGHLLITASRLQFQGAVDVRIRWSDVTAIYSHRREILVVLQEGARELRFCCHSYDEAARGAAIAEHLARMAQADPDLGTSEYHVRA